MLNGHVALSCDPQMTDVFQSMLARDVRAVLRLLYETHGLARQPALWKQHMLEKLCQLVRAPVGMMSHLRNVQPGKPWQVVSYIDNDDDGRRRHRAARVVLDGHERRDPMQALARRRGQLVTVRRRDVIDDGAWYASSQVQEVRRAVGVDDCIYSLYRLPRRGWAMALCVHRAWGDSRPFTEREQQIVHLIHSGLDCFYQREAGSSEPAGEDPGLTARMRQTLHLLLSGASEKQVAAAMSLSRHTVHVYVRSLYRRFNVNSRAELLALFVPRSEYGEETPEGE